MATTSTNGFFWDSVNHDRIYDAGSFENWLKKFFTSGVFTGDLQVTQTDALQVTVGTGYCNIDGKVQIFQNPTALSISPGNATYPRIDNVVVERNNSNRDIYLKIVKGTENSSMALAPARIWNDTIKQLVIAQISIPAGATSIIQANITDTRAGNLCGIVAGTVKEIDFFQIQKQFDSYFENFKKTKQTAFSEWFENVKDQLSTDAAGNLQNEIDNLQKWKLDEEILVSPSAS